MNNKWRGWALFFLVSAVTVFLFEMSGMIDARVSKNFIYSQGITIIGTLVMVVPVVTRENFRTLDFTTGFLLAACVMPAFVKPTMYELGGNWSWSGQLGYGLIVATLGCMVVESVKGGGVVAAKG
jgi:hypothetical protein